MVGTVRLDVLKVALVCLLAGSVAVRISAADAGFLREATFAVLADASERQRQGDHDAALVLLLDALASTDLNDTELALLNRSVAASYVATRRYDEASETYRKVVKAPAGLTPQQLDDAWSKLATLTYKQGAFAQVIEVVAAWQRRVGTVPPASHRLLAFAHWELGNRTAAIAEGERYASALRESGEVVPEQFANFLRHVRRPEGSTSDIDATNLPAGTAAPVKKALAEADRLYGRASYERGISMLRQTLATPDLGATDVALVREKLAWGYAWQGDFTSVEQELRTLVEQPGQLPKEALDQAWRRLAAAQYKRGAYEDATRSIETWRQRLEHETPLYYRLLAMANWQLGNEQTGNEYGRRYRQLARAAGEAETASFLRLEAKVNGDAQIR